MNALDRMLHERTGEIISLFNALENEDGIYMRKTIPTLKATAFLMLYNMVESIVYTSFEVLFDEIAINCDDFFKLKNEVQAMYNNYNSGMGLDYGQLLSIDFKKYCGRRTVFSGNVDARLIREEFKRWGINDDFHFKGEEELLYVKNYRNKLAHGERTFKEVGREFTISEMRKKLSKVEIYMGAYIEIFVDYLENRKYMNK